MRCFIQASHPLVTERGRAAAQILYLASGPWKETPRDEAELELYDEASKILFSERSSPEALAVGKIRVDAVKSNPKDERLAKACFRSCLKNNDIEHAQQVSGYLEHCPKILDP